MATERLRGRAAVVQRARRLKLHPLCAHCLEGGVYTATDEIDHIVRIEDDGPDTDDNVQGLCFAHHKAKTSEENGGASLIGYTQDGKPIDINHPWSGSYT